MQKTYIGWQMNSEDYVNELRQAIVYVYKKYTFIPASILANEKNTKFSKILLNSKHEIPILALKSVSENMLFLESPGPINLT